MNAYFSREKNRPLAGVTLRQTPWIDFLKRSIGGSGSLTLVTSFPFLPAPVVQAIRAVASASASAVGSDGLQGASQGATRITIAILVTVLVLVGLGITYHWWRPATPIHSTVKSADIGTLPISLQHAQCAIAAGNVTASVLSAVGQWTRISIAGPSKPAAGSSVPPPAATNGAKSHASVPPKDSDSDSFRCPEASDIKHRSECNASFLEMMSPSIFP
ncbi:uncharacterized protein HD556DRAFT_1438900 [Suillus plorans]|uniref:Uncharacterized protein n=1 Tax=Suillus plorans TaxID=116603 RepID=A0A9P7DR17_9AGAM|nr:uncharacterized protein HD556DRAFT_1438900 [Suillus plorans]KAG1800899.1 hypothetical protein HD556DRAFT_1438900 [Suillus plorans]